MRIPRLGTTVFYRSKTGRYTIPAIITATTETLYAPAVEGGHIPALSSDLHVHLACLTPGIPGERLPDTDPNLGRDTYQPGVYQEWDIPFWQPTTTALLLVAPGTDSPQPSGSWTFADVEYQ